MAEQRAVSEFDIAIVGAAGRFPGAADLQAFWSNLAEGRESIRRFSDDELRDAGVPETSIADPAYVKAAPVLDQPGRFDAAFFGYSPRDASLIDPQQRHLLELAWLAFEDAGIVPGQEGGRCATFAGTAMNTYLLSTALAEHFFADYLPVLLGSDKDFQATRIAFKLGLTGPAISVQTACSTSLVAVHLACQSLINRESDLALAAAAAVRCPSVRGHRHEASSVFTPDGHCRPFDADARGTIFGSGAGALLLKRLDDALADGDPVRAVIKGSAVNNDGDAKADFTAPTVRQQAEAISEAMGSADVSADTIDYIEAHGTGTALGDPIEVAALQQAFANDTERLGFCGLGSVKSNIGHLDVAAGMAAVIKVLLALEHQSLPATLHYRRANPQIDFAATPFRVIAEREAWPLRSDTPRRAGVTSLGMGGTNAHVVIEEAPRRAAPTTRYEERAAQPGPPLLLPLSGRDAAALQHRIADLADWLQRHPDAPLASVAHTLQTGRRPMAERRVAIATSALQAAQVLDPKQRLRLAGAPLPPARRKLVLMFPGQGAQRAGMSRSLYDSDGVFRAAIDRVCASLADEPGLDLHAVLFPASGAGAVADIDDTRLAQPALFAVEFAWLEWWRARGAEPAAFIGHSIGEYVAAVASGVFSVEDAARLVAARGRLMQAAERGSMLAVQRSETEVRPGLPEALDIAVVNAADSVVVAGPTPDIEAYAAELAGSGGKATVLRTSHAFHSRMMEPVLADFEAIVAAVERHRPNTPFISSSTGGWIGAEQAMDPAYWSAHIREAVRFHDGLTTLCELGSQVAIEAGPGKTLTALFNQHPGQGEQRWAVASAGSPAPSAPSAPSAQARQAASVASAAPCDPSAPLDDEQASLLALGRLWCSGLELPWPRSDEAVPRLALPGYRFGGSEHWYAAPDEPEREQSDRTDGPSPPIRSSDPLQWAREQGWALVTTAGERLENGARLVIGDGATAARIAQSSPAARLHSRSAIASDGYRAFVQERVPALLPEDGALHLVYAWPAAESGEAAYLDLVHLIQALTLLDGAATVRLDVITRGALDVLCEGVSDPDPALALGACEVANKEWQHVQARLIDLDPGERGDADGAVLDRLLASVDAGSVLGIRAGRAWRRIEQPAPLPAPLPAPDRATDAGGGLRGGAHVLVGGFGGIGQALAAHLLQHGERVVLTHRPSPASSDDRAAVLERLRAGAAEAAGAGSAAAAGTVQALELVLEDADEVSRALHDAAGDSGVATLYHLGGRTADGLLVARDDAGLLEVLAAKVGGSRVLADALARLPGHAPLVLFSSVAAWSGPAGQIDYAAANAWQMAFARTAPAGDHPVLAIAWPGWRGTGMVSRIGDEAARAAAQAHGLDPEDGLAILDAALRSGRDVVWVSPVELAVLDAPRRAVARAGGRGDGRAAGRADGRADSRADWRADGRSASDEQTPAGTLAASVRGGAVADSSTEARVTRHWLDLLGFERIEPDENFFDIGGTSLVSVQLCGRLERDFGVPLAAEEMLGSPTIAALSALIESRMTPPAAVPGTTDEVDDPPEVAVAGAALDAPDAGPPPVLPGARSLVTIAAGPSPGPSSDDSPLPVHLVHAHGGMIMGYQRLAQRIARSRPVLGLQAQGVRGDAAPLRHIESMAARYAQEILARDPGGPYVLGGYCMGGTIAWEIARQLEAAGHRVALVFLLQSFHKDLEYPIVQDGRTAYPAHVGVRRRVTLVKDKAVEALTRHYRNGDGALAGSVALVKGSIGRLRHTVARRRRAAAGPPGLNSVDNAALLDVHRANGEAFYRYLPGPLAAPVVFYPAEHQPRHIGKDSSLGWAGLARGSVAVHPVPGSFLIGLDGLDLERVAERLERDIADGLQRIDAADGDRRPLADA